MKTKMSILILFFVLAVGCDSVSNNCIEGSGSLVEVVLSHDNFTKIETRIGDHITVYLHQSDTSGISIVTDDNIMNYLELVPDGQTALIRDRTSENLCATKIELHIRANNFESFICDGSCILSNETNLVLNDILFDFDGSCEILLDSIIANNITVNADGSAEVHAVGTCNTVNADIDGTCVLRLAGLEANNANFNIDGSGNIYVWAKENLYVRVNGSGSVKYKGDPVKDIHFNGSGNVEQLP